MPIQPKSALFVGAFPAPASLERYVSGDLALRLQALGWRTHVTSRSPGRLRRLSDIVSDTWRARRDYALACIDLFSGPAFIWAEVACALLSRLRKPYVLVLHGGSLPEFSRRYPLRVKRLLSRAGAVTCPSPYLLHEMRQFRPDLLLLPNALDLTRYSFREPRPPLKQLVWLRAFHEIYNPQLAVKVLGKLKARHEDVRLSMLGPDKGDGSLQQAKATALNLGVDQLVDFPGAVSKQEVPHRLAQGDIFLNTTNFDNTPVSVLEAMASGLPVVSTNVGGIPYLLQDKETALLVPSDNVEAMTNAVTRLLRQPELSMCLARNGRKLAEAFDWSVILPKWEKLLEQLLSARPCAPNHARHGSQSACARIAPSEDES